ncbi:MAG: A/G-specific adenine glycosylase [Bacteroidota bacterium]|nr:A/G-specific adenine glycosylase [Bacteroidota bacterium]
MSEFASDKLIEWYQLNKRELPWRDTKDPYLIWISEIILQQTRVSQGLPYYHKFVERFPNVKQLANCEEDEVLKYWEGLGYYSRARNLHAAAKQIVNQYNGLFPNTFNEIIKLKGVGRYTAAAIASFAFNEKVPVLDGNVIRVLSRYFSYQKDVRKQANQDELFEIAKEIISRTNPDLYNQAIMEFGALVCKPQNPECESCIFNIDCIAKSKSLQNDLPIKSKLNTLKNRYFNYLIFEDNLGKITFRKRVKKDIWKNMYEFHLIESNNQLLSRNEIEIEIKTILNSEEKFELILASEIIVQKLTHQKINAIFWRVLLKNISNNFKKEHNFLVLNPEQSVDYAKPLLISNFVQNTYFKP